MDTENILKEYKQDHPEFEEYDHTKQVQQTDFLAVPGLKTPTRFANRSADKYSNNSVIDKESHVGGPKNKQTRVMVKKSMNQINN